MIEISDKNIYLLVCNGGNMRNTWHNYAKALIGYAREEYENSFFTVSINWRTSSGACKLYKIP